MKKHLFYLAAAVVAMSSCTESEVIEISQSKAIGFDSYVGNTTRAEQEGQTLDVLKEEGNGFYVFGAYKEGENDPTIVFDGHNSSSHVTWREDEKGNGKSWGYSPVNFWLERGIYKFGAYAPKLNITPTFDYATNEMTFSKFEATDGKTDLLVAAANKDGISGAAPTMVSFAFKHALSKVRFTIIDGWRNDVELVISDVKLVSVKSTGTLVTPATLKEGTLVHAENWTVETATTDYKDAGATLTQLNATYLFDNFVIPQTINDALALEFTVVVNNPNGTSIKLDAEGNTTKNITVPVSTESVTKWLPGNAYNYKLTISGNTFGLNPIQFEATEVKDWNENDITDGKTPIVTKP
ncbi:fimbrillin family protein [uncultured Bacteroides sp.]|uniref:fimbrillin family protein n=1 Tax=uncultured Bacteroides sp. TaxID=162156 RepID=UPI002635872B|nr:fimbrillin family protein [uncultured Bacteroides sp.]